MQQDLGKLCHQKVLSPAHSHPPCWTDEASFWWKCSALRSIFHPAAASEDIRAQWINYI